jgi:hypothetical protein
MAAGCLKCAREEREMTRELPAARSFGSRWWICAAMGEMSYMGVCDKAA